MTSPSEKACSDCGGTVAEIRLIDKSDAGHKDVEYTFPEAKRSLWMGQFPIEGKVVAFMCGQCGRISLYGKPEVKS